MVNINKTGNTSRIFISTLLTLGLLGTIAATTLHYLDIFKVPQKAFVGILSGALALTLLSCLYFASKTVSLNNDLVDVNTRLNNAETELQKKQEKTTV